MRFASFVQYKSESFSFQFPGLEQSARMIKRSLCALQSKLKGSVLLVLQQRNVTNSVRSS